MGTKISAYTELTSPAAGDRIPIVDVSDTSMAASGTTKYVTHGTIKNAQPKARDYTYSGTLVAGSGTIRLYFPRAATVFNVAIAVSTAPTGAAVIVDIHLNGTTMFTTQANRPTIAVSTFNDLAAVPDVTTISAGQYLTVDIDQIGSTVAGENLVVTVEYYEA